MFILFLKSLFGGVKKYINGAIYAAFKVRKEELLREISAAKTELRKCRRELRSNRRTLDMALATSQIAAGELEQRRLQSAISNIKANIVKAKTELSNLRKIMTETIHDKLEKQWLTNKCVNDQAVRKICSDYKGFAGHSDYIYSIIERRIVECGGKLYLLRVRQERVRCVGEDDSYYEYYMTLLCVVPEPNIKNLTDNELQAIKDDGTLTSSVPLSA